MIEPIALYHTRNLLDEKDGRWLSRYPSPDRKISLGEIGIEGDGPLAIITYGNGRYLSKQAAEDLAADGIKAKVIDLRWLAPLPADALLEALEGAEKVLVVDECRATGGQSEALMALLYERVEIPHARIAAEDSFIPTGPAYASTMPSRASIASAAKNLWKSQ